MEYKLSVKRLRTLLYQRGILGLFTVFLILSNIVLLFCLVTQKDRIIIYPTGINTNFWIEKNRASTQYLHDLACLFSNRLLTQSPRTSQYSREEILRYVHPSYYNSIRSQLIESAEALKQNDASTCFRIQNIEVSRRTNAVLIDGELETYMGDKRVSQERHKYRIDFIFQYGRVFLKGFTRVKK